MSVMSDQDHGRKEIVIMVDSELQELIPGYLEKRLLDVDVVLSALESGDFVSIQSIGHKMKGTGGSYGFDMITEIGRNMEKAAMAKLSQEIEKEVSALKSYLVRLKVVYRN